MKTQELITAIAKSVDSKKPPSTKVLREVFAYLNWHHYAATHTLPDDIPRDPDIAYASEWIGWEDWSQK